MSTQTRIWTKEEIVDLLKKNDKMVTKSLLKLFDYQTAEEQNAEATLEHNGVGFNGADSNILSSFAKQLKEKNFLSIKQIEIARKKLIKYAGQITRIANGGN